MLRMYISCIPSGLVTRIEETILKQYLIENGVMCKVYFYPVHLHTYYKKNHGEIKDLPVTEHLANVSLTIPIYVDMSDAEIEHIEDLIREYTYE